VIPLAATLIVIATEPGENGRYFEYVDAGSPTGHRLTPDRCIPPHGTRPRSCRALRATEQAEAKRRQQQEREAAERGAAKERERFEAREREERAEREASEAHARAVKEALEARERQEAKQAQEITERLEREASEAREKKEHEEREASEKKEHEEREASEKKEREEREQHELTTITSVNNTRGDVGPFEGEYSIADQPFMATSDTITYAGVTTGNPNVPIGPSVYAVDLRICVTRECTGTGSELGSGEATVNNYGLSAADLGEITVTPGHTYYLVWNPPSIEVAGAHWVAFWHEGEPHIVGSSRLEAIVRGYNHDEGGPHRVDISYGGTVAPPAPFAGPFVYAYQDFKAASDRITKLGVVVGNPLLPREKEATQKIVIRLCATPNCATAVLAAREVRIDNYGITEARFPGVEVTPGETYYVNWQAPESYEGEPWQTFWYGKARLENASQTEAFAAGYDEHAHYAPTYVSEKPEKSAVSTFRDYENATGEGEEIGANQTVEVTCKVFAPYIESAEPDGFWYRIHSKPWNDEYYAVANAFRNIPGSGEGINTDQSVPDC
jgi:hypothetical protein